MPHTPSVPDFTRWPSFPFEGEFHVKDLDPPVAVEPARKGEGSDECVSCNAPDDAYIWISERWRVRAMDRPTGLPMVLILESRSHLDLGDLPNLLAAELGVMTVRLERAIRSLDGVARVHVNRWGDGSAHLHMWFLARPYGRLQLRGTFLSLWDDILPPIPESQWRENLALVAAWLAEFGGRPLAEPPRIQWQAPSNLVQQASAAASAAEAEAAAEAVAEAARVAADASVALVEAPPDETSSETPEETPEALDGLDDVSEGSDHDPSPANGDAKSASGKPDVEGADPDGPTARDEASTGTTTGAGSGIAVPDKGAAPTTGTIVGMTAIQPAPDTGRPGPEAEAASETATEAGRAGVSETAGGQDATEADSAGGAGVGATVPDARRVGTDADPTGGRAGDSDVTSTSGAGTTGGGGGLRP